MSKKQYYDFLCACGCGEKIEIKEYHSKKGYVIPKYLVGHHMKTELFKKEVIKRSKGKFPWNKGKKCPQISKSKIGRKNPMYGKESCRKGKTYNEIYGTEKEKEIKKKMSEAKKGNKNPKYWKEKERSFETNKKISNKVKSLWDDSSSIYNSKKYKRNILESRKSRRRSISKIKKKYPIFYKEEEMRYNPNKPAEKEIQVHCKYSECINSKENDGWFTPTGRQIEQRIYALEHTNEGSYMYCSDECKSNCKLYYLRSDPNQNTENNYIPDYETFRQEVLRRQQEEYGYNFCEYCDLEENLHVHHEKPQKTNPLFVLDPDNGIVLCKECHYIIGHKDECSTGNLANKIC